MPAREVWGRWILPGGVGAALGALVLWWWMPAPPPDEPVEQALGARFIEDVWPTVAAYAPDGELAAEVRIHLSAPVAPYHIIGVDNPEGTNVVLDPPVQGTIVWTDRDTLSFRPAEPLAYETTYRVQIHSLTGESGPLLPAASGEREAQHAAQFTTPAFHFVSMRLHSLTAESADLDLVFSGPLVLDGTAPLVHLSLGRAELSEVSLTADRLRPHHVRATVRSRALAEGGLLTLDLGGGVRSTVADAVAPTAVARVELPAVTEAAVETVMAVVGEASNSASIDFYCRDTALQEPLDWNWLPGIGSVETSARCLPTEASLREHIRLSPEIPFTAVPRRGGFRLIGDFPRGTMHVQLFAGTRTVDGSVLRETFEQDLTIRPLSPSLTFDIGGRYLPREAWSAMALHHRNIGGQIDVTIRHVPSRNLVFWMTNYGSIDERTADVVARQTLWPKGQLDKRETLWLDVASLVPDPKPGLYEIIVQGGGTEASVRTLLTDTQIVAKSDEAGGFTVWALDTHTNALVSGVRVEAVRPSGTAIGVCTTEGASGCTIAPGKDRIDTTSPIALIARRGADLTYVKFDELRESTSEFHVYGESWAEPPAYHVALHGDRGVYRPGETAHAVGIVRTEWMTAPEVPLPVTLELYDPRGSLVKTTAVRTDAMGALALDLPLPDYATTGRYRLAALIGNNPMQSWTFNVEEFVPERMEVKIAPEKRVALQSELVPIRIDARYLFGGDAGGSHVALTCALEPEVFSPKDNRHYTYGTGINARPMEIGATEGEIAQGGHAELSCPEIAAGGALYGPSILTANVAVSEAGSGRTTFRRTQFEIHPNATYLGLRTDTQQADKGVPIEGTGVVVDWNGQIVDTIETVEVELVRTETEWNWQMPLPEQQTRFVSDGRQQVAVKKGRFRFSLTPSTEAEHFELRVRSGEMRTDLPLNGGSASDDYTYTSYGPGGARPLTLETPALLQPGETATVSFDAPYAGRLLMTVETDRVIAHEWRTVEAGPVSWSFHVDTFMPNVYVGALLVKDPHLESDEAYLPARAFGVKSVPMKPVPFEATLGLSVPAEVRPHEPLEITVDLGPAGARATVTVAAIDEGILSLTHFQRPSPLEQLIPTKRLGVETFETVGWTQLQGSTPGGLGGDGDGSLRRPQMVKPAALWSGPVTADAHGKAIIRFTVPQYQGQLRVTAVAVTADRIGVAETRVTVRDPLVLQTTVPRFLIRGDEAQVPVFLTNMSGRTQQVSLRFGGDTGPLPGASSSSEQPIEFIGASETTLTLNDGESRTSVFRVRALAGSGYARLRVEARAGQLHSEEELLVPFSVNGPRERASEQIVLTKGTVDIDALIGQWAPGTARSSLWVTANPYGRSFSHLSYLATYPYGCIEQTTSGTRPLLYLSSLPGMQSQSQRKDIDNKVASGIARVLSMQTYSGGFGYWHGGDTPHLWGTAYATHLLLDAAEAGYDVPKSRLDSALAWLGAAIAVPGGEEDPYHDSPGGVAYAAYVLAKGGRGDIALAGQQLARHPAARDSREAEQIYLLQAALYLSGDRRYAEALREPDRAALVGRVNGADFYSDLRSYGLMLSVYQDLFGRGGAGGERLAKQVGQALADDDNSAHFTTQELAWGITGLGRWIAPGAKDFVPPVLSRDGVRIAADPGDTLSWTLAGTDSEQLSLDVSDPGTGALYLVANTEGVREAANYPVGGSGLAVKREWLDAGGAPVDLAAVKLGDSLFTRITLTNRTAHGIPNVALTDRIPAGFEIENPRLGRDQSIVVSTNLWSTEHLNLRDDRVEVFGRLAAGESVDLLYQIRAVTAGHFRVPPVEAEVMYDPKLWAREAGAEVEITGPWAGFFL